MSQVTLQPRHKQMTKNFDNTHFDSEVSNVMKHAVHGAVICAGIAPWPGRAVAKDNGGKGAVSQKWYWCW